METKKASTSTFPMSSPTEAFCLSKPIENATKRRWLEKLGLPTGDKT